MADEAVKLTVRKVRVGARIVQVLAVVAGVLLAGPDLVAEYVTHEGADNPDAAIIIAIVCVVVSGIAAWAARGFERGLSLPETETRVDAGLGDSFVIVSVGTGSARELHHVITDDKPADPLPLSPLQDAVVESFGGGCLAYGMAVFLWLFLATIILGFAGVFQGNAPGAGAIAGVVLITLGAAAITTFRWRRILSNRDKAVHSVLACLGFRRRRSRPYDTFDAVTLRHSFTRSSSSSSPGGQSTSQRTTHNFNVLLTGPDEIQLQSFHDAFKARGRARQLAAYMGKPLVEPRVEDVSTLPLMEASP